MMNEMGTLRMEMMTAATILIIRIIAGQNNLVVLTHGTDTMIEV